MDLTLPLDYAAIERILLHRYPFLFVDRITEFEVDKRIVGIKNVSLNERYLSHATNGAPVLPPTILTEAVAQVGAIMILAKPENRQRLIFFAGIERVRYRRPVHAGDVVDHRSECRPAAQPHGPPQGRGAGGRQGGHRRDHDVRAGAAAGGRLKAQAAHTGNQLLRGSRRMLQLASCLYCRTVELAQCAAEIQGNAP